MKAKVLLIDDDASFTGIIGIALGENGHEVLTAGNGLEGLQRLYQYRPDLVVLDTVMPRMDGWETCQRIREVSDVPILMLTSRGGEVEELKALRSGADQCITKPFPISVLLARVEALIRRTRLAAGDQPVRAQQDRVIVVGRLRIDLGRYEASLGGVPLDLSPTEFRLLAALASHCGEAVHHRDLLAQVWGPHCVDEAPYLSLYIYYLRQKIEEDPAHPRHILTKRGVGYYLEDMGASKAEPALNPASACSVG